MSSTMIAARKPLTQIKATNNTPLPATKVYGLTQVMSTAYPKASEFQATEEMKKVLEKNGSFEPSTETEMRLEVLTKLNVLAKRWIMNITVQKKLPISNPGGKVMAFGSYRLGVHSSGGDIDTVLVAPSHVSRKDFFTSFKNLLQEQKEVTGLNAIETAFVPIITLKFSTVEVDISFAQLAMSEVPEELNVMDDSILMGLEKESIRSLNGCRVAEELLANVPNQKEFALVLRVIKMWAQRKGLNKNATGFFGGVTWAIMVARVCQLWPNATASTLVEKFFLFFSTWQWPAPVLLKMIDNSKGDLPSMVWDPRVNLADRHHLMPVITPAYPSQNSTYNVSQSTASVIKKEITDGYELCKKIKVGEATWDDLLEEHPFFLRYKHYIALVQSASSEEDELKHSGFFQSKIRHLVMALERSRNIRTAHCDSKQHQPSPRAKMEILKDPKKKVTIWTIGLEFEDHVKAVDLTSETERFKQTVSNAAKNVQTKSNVDVDAFYVKRSDLFFVVKDLPMPKKKAMKRAAGQVQEGDPKKQKL